MPTSNGHLDWLAVTYPVDTPVHHLLPGCIGELPLHDEGRAILGYRTRQVNEVGCVILSGGSERQGIHVINGGEALVGIREKEITDWEMATHCRDHYGRPTRLDVAIDLFEGRTKREDLVAMYSAGRVRTHARSAQVTKSLSTPEGTLYLGTRSSMRFFRAYDKGAQMNDPRAWLRLELECKKLQAQAMLEALSIQTDTRAVINRAIKQYVEFPDLPEIVEALREDNAVIPRVPRKMTNTLRWLLNQVAPALARYEHEHPDDNVRQSFLTAWRIALASLMRPEGPTDDDDDNLQWLNELSYDIHNDINLAT